MYRLLQSQCRIEKLVKDLDGEINELHHYVLQRQEKQRNERLETLTVLGAIFLAPSLIFGLYGVSILNGLPRPCLNLILPVLAGITIIIAILSWLAFGKRKNRVLRFLFFVIMTGALFSPVVVVNLPICKIIPVKESELKRKPEQENILPPSIPLDTVKTNFHE